VVSENAEDATSAFTMFVKMVLSILGPSLKNYHKNINKNPKMRKKVRKFGNLRLVNPKHWHEGSNSYLFESQFFPLHRNFGHGFLILSLRRKL